MKQGKSLVELAQELTRIKETTKDYVVPTALLCMNESGNLEFTNGSKQEIALTNWSGGQLASYTDIPKPYYDRIKTENPALLADNVNHGLKHLASANKKESRLVRLLDGNVRGLLSPRYRILDGYDLLENIFPEMHKNNLQVVSSELTEKRMYIKATSEKLTTEVKKGDVVQYGLTISTSDVGAGSLRVEPFIYRLVCSNGLIMSSSIRKAHLGRNMAGDGIEELLTDSTRELTDRAFWAQVKDVVTASMSKEFFESQVDQLRIAANEEIKNFDLPRVVELTMKATGLTGEQTKNSIVAALASGNEGAGLTRWGLINSFTRAAQDDAFDYESSVDLERAAGQILTLNRDQWKNIAAVA